MAPTITTPRFGPTTSFLKRKWFREGCRDETLLEFSNNEISNLNDLRRQYRTCGIVAIDTEGTHHGGLVHEIAFSFLPPLNASEVSTHRLPPDRFASFLVPTYTVSVIGRRSPVKGHRERLDHGALLPTFPEDVEDKILDILEMFVSTMPTMPPLILAGFDLKTELKVLKNQYPRVLQRFWGWTDIQRHCTEMVTIFCNDTRGANAQVGMRNTLLALGYTEDAAVNTMQHRAGNDTARMIAIFLHLVNRPPDSPKLQLQLDRRWRRRTFETFERSFFDTRPPVEEYPFTVKLSRSGAVMSPKTVKWGVFSHFEITAFGIRPQEESPRFCWISFPSLEVLRRFVQYTNSLPPRHSQKCPGVKHGCICGPSDRVRFQAEACLPSGTEHWTDQEREKLLGDQAKERARERKASEIQAARERRKENRSLVHAMVHEGEMDLEEGGYCISWGNDDDGGDGSGEPQSHVGSSQEASWLTGMMERIQRMTVLATWTNKQSL